MKNLRQGGVDIDEPQRWYVHENILQKLTANFNPCWHALIESGCFHVEKGEEFFFFIELQLIN